MNHLMLDGNTAALAAHEHRQDALADADARRSHARQQWISEQIDTATWRDMSTFAEIHEPTNIALMQLGAAVLTGNRYAAEKARVELIGATRDYLRLKFDNDNPLEDYL